MKKSLGKFTGIIIHHSATEDSQETKSWDAIKRYHVETNGWDDIGYHFGIEEINYRNQLLFGRSLEYYGAHCPPNDTIGICVVGNYDKEDVSEDKLKLLVRTVLGLLLIYDLTPNEVHMHNEFANKTCPGIRFPWQKFKFFLDEGYQKAK